MIIILRAAYHELVSVDFFDLVRVFFNPSASLVSRGEIKGAANAARLRDFMHGLEASGFLYS